jgi:SulP family sulfate permease
MAGLSELAEPGTSRFLQLAIATSLIAGAIQMVLGGLRLGFFINFLSHPVISGFTSAAAIIIGFSQANNILGLNVERSNQIHILLGRIFAQIDGVHLPTLLIGLGGIAFMLILRRINRAIPSALLATVVGTALVAYFQFDQYGVAILGKIPEGLPAFEAPQISWQDTRDLLPLALTICVISFIESLAIAKTLEAKHRDYKVVPDQELIALGITKLGGAFFQAFPTTGSFTRSAINNEAGAKTGIASIFAAILIAFTLLFLTPWFFYLPKAILASIIVVATLGLINYKEAIHLFHADRRDFYILMITFIGTLTMGIQSGVLLGFFISIAIMVYRNAKPHFAVLGKLPDTPHYRNVDRFAEATQEEDILVVRFDAQLYFGNAAFFQDEMERLLKKHEKSLKLFVLDASNIHDMASSGIRALQEIMIFLYSRRIAFHIAGPIGPVRDAISRHGLLKKIGTDHCFLSISDAIEAFRKSEDQANNNPSNILHSKLKND